MTSKKETFSTLLKEFEHRYELRSVFDDFLTIAICSFADIQSPEGELYTKTMLKYEDRFRRNFSEMLILLICEMDKRTDDEDGNDVLGEFFETEFGEKNIQWSVCLFMAKVTRADNDVVLEESRDNVLRILDPCCRSGRMLHASATIHDRRHRYYGISIDHTCVKMTALNLFLNNVYDAEVMWADVNDPDDFRISYITSYSPFGVFQVTEKEKSPFRKICKGVLKTISNSPNLIQKIQRENGGILLVLL